MKIRISRIYVISSAMFVLSAAHAASTPSPEKFLSSAIQDGRAEVAVCQLALTKASSPDVKAFAQRMIKDHSETDSKIEALAKSKNYKLASGTTIKQKASYELLKHRSGASFDKSFMEHNVSDHESDVKHFSDQAKNAKDAEVKDFAVATLATLQEHLAMAQDVKSKVVANK